MPVRVRLSPHLWKYVPGYDHNKGIMLENMDGRAVRQIIEELKIPPEEVYAIMLNSYPGKPNSVVHDGDSVTLTKIIGGG
jgi:sulfur carrier protein ThiS